MERKVWHKVSDKEYPDLKREFVWIDKSNERNFCFILRSMSTWISTKSTPQRHCEVMEIVYWAYLDELLPKDIYDDIKEHNPTIL